MIRLIQLLNEKNHFLEKFMSLNEKQIVRLEEGHFDQIEAFYNKREDMIKIIKYIDAEINKTHLVHKDINGVFTDMQKVVIKECLRIKESYVAQILDQDMQVLGLIDKAKSDIIKELQDVRLAKKAMHGYKSNVA